MEVLLLPMWPRSVVYGDSRAGNGSGHRPDGHAHGFRAYHAKQPSMYEFHINESVPCGLCHIWYVRDILCRPQCAITDGNCAKEEKEIINVLENIRTLSTGQRQSQKNSPKAPILFISSFYLE